MTTQVTGVSAVDKLLNSSHDTKAFTKLLKKLRTPLNTQYTRRTTIVIELVKKGATAALMKLLQHAQERNLPLGLEHCDDAGLPALFYCVRMNNPEALVAIVKEGKATLPATLADGRDLLDYTCSDDVKLTGINRLKLILEILEMMPSFPQFMTTGRTIMQEVIHLVGSNLEKKEDDPATLKRLLNQIVEFFTEAARGSIANYNALFTMCSHGGNVLHDCIEYNLTDLFILFLDDFRSKGPEFLKQEVEHVDDDNWTPLLTCCCTRYNYFNEASRIPILTMLLNNGADIDEFVPNRKMTPLMFAVTRRPMSEALEQVACFLIDRGADIFKEHEDRYPPAYHILTRELHRVLEYVLKRDLVPKETKFGGGSDCFVLQKASSRMAAFFRDTPAVQLKSRMTEHMKTLEILVENGFPTDGSLHFLLSFRENPAGRYLFKRLLDLGAVISSRYTSKLPLVACCVAKNDFRYFKVLLAAGASVDEEKEVKLCQNVPCHRWVTYPCLGDKNITDKSDRTRSGICCLCMSKFVVEEGTLSCCAQESCDFLICEDCCYFKAPGKQDTRTVTVSSLLLAERKSEVLFSNNLNYMLKSKVGRKLREERLIHVADVLMNAKVTTPEILKELSAKDLRSLGIHKLTTLSSLSSIAGKAK